MSTIVDDPSPLIATRLRAERDKRGWSLGDLAETSGVSKAMLSKIEREEASPTAAILARIGNAFGLTLAELVAPTEPKALLRAADQPQWRDPGTGYVRRQIFQSPASPLEIVEVALPPGARVAFPASSYALIRQVVWVISGRLDIRDGNSLHSLRAGDRLEFGPPADSEFRNTSTSPCRYVLVVLRR